MGAHVADEQMSGGEIRERFRGIDKRLDGIDARLDRMLPTETFTMADRHTAERIAEVDRASRERDDDLERTTAQEFKEIKERGQMTRGQLIAVLIGVATVAATVVGAYISAKGIK